jgi:hypothetical protein
MDSEMGSVTVVPSYISTHQDKDCSCTRCEEEEPQETYEVSLDRVI